MPSKGRVGNLPYVAIGNNELGQHVKEGDLIKCRRCGENHPLVDSKPPMLMSYKCKGSTFMGAIKGRLVSGVEKAEP